MDEGVCDGRGDGSVLFLKEKNQKNFIDTLERIPFNLDEVSFEGEQRHI